MENRKRYKILLLLSALLLVICIIQTFFILKMSGFNFPWGNSQERRVDAFSRSFVDEFKRDREESWDKLDRFFDEDFFKRKADPFQEMERMQKHMQEMMEKDFQKSFKNSWDEWFSKRFHKEDESITIDTEEKKDCVLVTIVIPNLKENQLNINIDNQGIHIEAEVEETIERRDARGNIVSRSKTHRTIDQTFPIPHNADYHDATMEYKKDTVIIRFPKLSS